MAIYFWLFLPILTTFALNNRKFRFFQVVLFFISCFGLYFLLGFRAVEVGTDTGAYYSSFFRIESAEFPFSLRYEPAYVLMNLAIQNIGFGPEVLIAVCSLIIIFSLVYCCLLISPSLGLSLILYAGIFGYFFAFNGMRQAVAQSLILLGFTLFEKGYRKLGCFSYLLAPLFHYTAVVFFPFLLLFLVKKERLIILLPLCWLISLFFVISATPFQMMSSFLFQLSPAIYSNYVDNISLSGDVGVLTAFYQLVFIFIYMSFSRCKCNMQYKVMLLGMLGVISANILNYSGFVSRLSLYWELFLILALPIASSYFYRFRFKVLISFLLFFVASIFYYRAVFVSSNNISPYSSWLLEL
ncbi:EpsG family protein [Salinivibrio kushneri]|uniref:EpsG family protein n=1 Tax=Salinivibrio kushneri TaxID=1908198 RepID=UPI0013016A75|nr:EpsG family protein [Salinivibrio kushneri]